MGTSGRGKPYRQYRRGGKPGHHQDRTSSAPVSCRFSFLPWFADSLPYAPVAASSSTARCPSGVSPSSSNTPAGCAARTDRRVTYPFWLFLSELVCPEGKRQCAGVSPLIFRVLSDRCRVCRARSLLKGLSSGLAAALATAAGAQHGRSAEVIRCQADPDRRATRPEDRKRRGRATHYERVPVRCSRVQKPAFPSGSAGAAGGDRWLLMAVRRHLGDTHPVALGCCPGFA